MPSKNQILTEIQETQSGTNGETSHEVVKKKYIQNFTNYTKRNLIAYYSACLERPEVTGTQINDKDLDAFMQCIQGMDKSIGLDLFIQTHGGSVLTANKIIDYIQGVFPDNIRVIIPMTAMSSGTMLACAANEIIMGKHSNLGPVDPSFRGVPCVGIVKTFEKARNDIIEHPQLADFWNKQLNIPPTFYYECEQNLKWARLVVKSALSKGMFKGLDDESINSKVNLLLDDDNTLVHSRPIHGEELKTNGFKISFIENDKVLQDLVLSLHHCYSIIMESFPVLKIIENQSGTLVLKIASENK